MDNNWFVIKDFNGFVKHTRIIVYNTYGNNTSEEVDQLVELSKLDQEELDKILSQAESIAIIKSIVKKQRNKKSKATRYIINDELYMNIVQSLGDRMTSNILHSLVNRGLVEMGFDDDANDFIFWIKE